MRFDDSLDTVLAADTSSPAAVEWTWRQLVDLVGRRQSAGGSRARDDAVARLHAIRPRVSRAARLAAARGLERADPPAALVALFVDQELAIAGPVVRSAHLTGAEWLMLLPAMMPAIRGVLRLRRDLPTEVVGALAAFGPGDFALHGPMIDVVEEDAVPAPNIAEPGKVMTVAGIIAAPTAVTEALLVEEMAPAVAPGPSRADFEIPTLVARLAAHRRDRGPPVPIEPREPSAAPAAFRFETDAAGLIRWVEGAERGPLIGLSLAAGRDGRPAQVDGVAAGALAHRSRFSDARLEVDGASDAAGSWRISAAPVFDRESGRFTGYRGTARRPRADEAARPVATDALRQLVHELRTPANAISGFAEMIEHQLLGPVPDAYREQAASIRGQTVGLLDAIDDLDTAARLEGRRLNLRSERVVLAPLATRILTQLRPLAELRGAELLLDMAETAAAGDAVAVERLLARFLAALVASARPGERIAGIAQIERDMVLLRLSRPAGFVVPGGSLFGGDAEIEAAAGDGPLLGTDFGFRLARRLAAELGGSLTIAPDALTLRLPAASEIMGHGQSQKTTVGPAGLETN